MPYGSNLKFICFSFLLLFANSVNSEPLKHNGRVSRAQFTTSINQREPVDEVVFLDDSANEVYFFTEILSMTGHKVIHRWEYNGQVMAKVGFDIGGPRWRINTKKKLNPNQKGKWTVVVTDGDGWPLAAKMFIYGNKEKEEYLQGKVSYFRQIKIREIKVDTLAQKD